jgi:predicted Rossmann fold flavoprotein
MRTCSVRDETIVIIGGGPAGLFCALRCAEPGRRVLVLEKKPSPGRKLLITGSGQCNLTHEGEIPEFFARYGDNGRFLRHALLNFTNRDLVAFFHDHGCPTIAGEGGKIFPVTRRSRDVLDVLLRECERKNVEIRCNEPVRRVESGDGRFVVHAATAVYDADDLVIATGGASYPATGSSGDGYRLAGELGHAITEIAPALVAVSLRDHPFSGLAGISFEGLSVSLFRDNKKIRQLAGDLLFTHTGLSGPAVLHLSRYIRPADVLKIAFLSGADRGTLRNDLVGRITAGGTRQVKTVLSDYSLPDRFVKRLLELTGIPPDLTCAHLSKQARSALITGLTEFPCTVSSVGGFHEAMVTRGGVALDGINPKTMESKIAPHLYVIGELLDIDGDTGGYNLQAAFSTAAVAAEHIGSRHSG